MDVTIPVDYAAIRITHSAVVRTPSLSGGLTADVNWNQAASTPHHHERCAAVQAAHTGNGLNDEQYSSTYH